MGIDPFVIHDRDMGKQNASAVNDSILKAVGDKNKVVALEECMEDLLGYPEPNENKPYKAYQFINDNWGSDWDGINPDWRSIIERLIFSRMSGGNAYSEVAASINKD
ncbi:hypothetical protein [Lentibacillus kimchii]|uniref:Uncharacterized protein n=1 Tax=Lentibacillus kimchii TaxID=1542911 RepID=A0ABW2USL3_9BACI